MQLYWQTLAHCLFSLPCNLHYDIHLMSSVSYSTDSDYLLSFQGLKLKVPLVTSIYSGILLKTVFRVFFDAQNILSLGLDSALGFQENWQPKSQALSLNDLPVLNNSWAWSSSQQNCRQLSVIPRLHQSIWGALWVAAVPTQGSGLDPCCWQVLNGLLPQLNVHTKFDFMLCLSEDFHTLYHAEGGGLKFCTFPNVGSLQHTICVRVLWSLAGCITLCRGTSLLAGHRAFVGHLWHFCPCSWLESHRVHYVYQY